MSESLRAALEKLDEAIDLLDDIALAPSADRAPDANIHQLQHHKTAAALDDVIITVRKMLDAA